MKIDPSQLAIENAPYAPMYASRGYSVAGPNERDEPAVHFFSFAITANGLIRALPLQVDPDADFLWRSTRARLVDEEEPGDVRLQFQDPWLNLMENALVVSANINGVSAPAPTYPEMLIPANGVFYVTTEEYTGGASTIYLACFGVKRFNCA